MNDLGNYQSAYDSLDPSPIHDLSQVTRRLRERGFGQRLVIPGRIPSSSSFDSYRPLSQEESGYGQNGMSGFFGSIVGGWQPSPFNGGSLTFHPPQIFLPPFPDLYDSELPPFYQFTQGGSGKPFSLNMLPGLEVKWFLLSEFSVRATYKWYYSGTEVDPVTGDTIADGETVTNTINIGENMNTSDIVSPGVKVAALLARGFEPLPIGVGFEDVAMNDGVIVKMYRVPEGYAGAATYKWVMAEMTNIDGDCVEEATVFDEGTF